MGRKSKYNIGDKFGELEILEIISSNKSGKHVNLRCRCHYCNNIIIINGVNLKKRNSCGCQQRNPNVGKPRGPRNMPWQLSPGMSAKNNVEVGYKRSAKRRGYSYNLTREQFDELINDNCHYCNEKNTSLKKGQGKTSGNFHYTGIDRIDNTKGYSIDNCVSCCWRCNLMKHTLTKDEFVKRIEKIYNNLNSQ